MWYDRPLWSCAQLAPGDGFDSYQVEFDKLFFEHFHFGNQKTFQDGISLHAFHKHRGIKAHFHSAFTALLRTSGHCFLGSWFLVRVVMLSSLKDLFWCVWGNSTNRCFRLFEHISLYPFEFLYAVIFLNYYLDGLMVINYFC